jgi:hypothetical protein
MVSKSALMLAGSTFGMRQTRRITERPAQCQRWPGAVDNSRAERARSDVDLFAIARAASWDRLAGHLWIFEML